MSDSLLLQVLHAHLLLTPTLRTLIPTPLHFENLAIAICNEGDADIDGLLDAWLWDVCECIVDDGSIEECTTRMEQAYEYYKKALEDHPAQEQQEIQQTEAQNKWMIYAQEVIRKAEQESHIKVQLVEQEPEDEESQVGHEGGMDATSMDVDMEEEFVQAQPIVDDEGFTLVQKASKPKGRK